MAGFCPRVCLCALVVGLGFLWLCALYSYAGSLVCIEVLEYSSDSAPPGVLQEAYQRCHAGEEIGHFLLTGLDKNYRKIVEPTVSQNAEVVSS